jgi:hypothetical protein
MRKSISYSMLIGIFFVSCEELYYPSLEKVSGLMVVDTHLTNDLNQNYVQLSISRDFNSTKEVDWIIGARIELIESLGTIIYGTEVSPGHFTFTEAPIPNKKYKLRISYKKDIFESDEMVMPRLPKIDSLYTIHKIVQKYRFNGFSTPELYNSPEREINVDASISPELEYYRFSYRAIIQWEYNPPSIPNKPSPPPLYGWITVHDNGSFNLAGQKEFSTNDRIHQHPILSLAYNSQQYLDSATQTPANWILIFDQYGITKETYDFYEKINNQFSAEGSLFDPMLSQIYGNFHCTTDASKTALGFFDLSSYRQYRYYLNLGTGADNQVFQRRLYRYFDIPDRGDTTKHPDFWENNYY